ncbi:ribosome small subunit-dependent GTPase A [Legionella dresdenensis]|uniref:Small ribosomal subunit biogenesis GTPase RsgA n=1 Tax=Legionella dresdenensis TaxID=450200 RepID=A0ABV8CCI1_9GAMM
MSKRRINKQQTARIEKIQARYRTDDSASSNNHDGLVLTRFSRHAVVEDENGHRIHCSIRPNIDSLVAGDKVIWQSANTEQGVVVSRYPRASVLERTDKRGGNKPVAANITQVLIVVAPKPELSWALLDSYLVMTENLDLNAVIILNKTDIPCADIQARLISVYQSLGYKLIFTCKDDSEGFDQLKQVLRDQVSVTVGQSGVGKSSLINRILPNEKEIAVAEISVISELGCHTTSNSYYYHLPDGGALVDSPGVREFGLWQMPASDILYGFREFRALAKSCKFRNCNHYDSPGCALLAAVDAGAVAQSRYGSLLKIIDGTPG